MENELIAAYKDFHINFVVSHSAGPEILCQQNLFVPAVLSTGSILDQWNLVNIPVTNFGGGYCNNSALPVKYGVPNGLFLCIPRCKFVAQLIKCISNTIKCISPSFRQFNSFFSTHVWIVESTIFPLIFIFFAS